MWRLGTTRAWGQRRGSRAAALLLLAPALIWSCGGSSEKSVSPPGAGGTALAGSSSSPTAGKPTTTGGSAAVAQGGASGSTAAGSGGQATAGAPITQAGAGGDEAVAGAGGAAQEYDPTLLGFECDLARCSVGQACFRCILGDVVSRKCVPSPSVDPAGFSEATLGCMQPVVFNDCDGPEDCPGFQYCVAAESGNGFMRCRNEPSSVNGSCCFACGALTDCTLCRSAADCPDHAACEPAQSAPAGIMGCARP